jgi:orotidine-5'-phosphate decarboxylase
MSGNHEPRAAAQAALDRNAAAGRIMVALDYSDAQQAEATVKLLQGIPCWMKVGMELFYAAGPEFVRTLKAHGHRVFVDLKLHDIPNTVRGGSASLARLGADMFNVHAAAGLAGMSAAMAGVNEALAEQPSLSRPLVIAVTQLTSTSQSVLNEEIGISGSVEDAVIRYAELAKQAGLDGVVASPLEVRQIKAACGSAFVTVTPGIRPHGSAAGDQARVTTPKQAFEIGSDFIVVGRPITAAAEPRAALESIIDEIVG